MKNDSSKEGLLPENEKTEEKKIDEEIFIERIKSNQDNYDYSIKVILLGNSNTGKTSIISRLINDTFLEDQRATANLDHHNLHLKINNAVYRLQIWDTAGQEKFDSITSNYTRSTQVAIFVYSINDLYSFQRLSNFLRVTEQIDDDKVKNEIDDSMVKILLGNKNDLENERKISYEEAKKFSTSNNFKLFEEISCKNDDKESKDKINKVFNFIGKIFYEKNLKAERLNSSCFNYVASNSILDSKSKGNSKIRGKCCC